MIQFIAFVIFIISSAGIFFILYRKAPALATLPKNGQSGIKKPGFVLNIEKKVKHHHFRLIAKQLLLQKLLSWIKVLTLKLETKTDTLLHGIRKRAQELDKQVKKRK